MFFFTRWKQRQLQFEADTRAKYPSLFEKSNWTQKYFNLHNIINKCNLLIYYDWWFTKYGFILDSDLELVLSKKEKKYLFKFLSQLLKELEIKQAEEQLQQAKARYINV